MTDDLTDRQRPWIPLTIMIASAITKQTCAKIDPVATENDHLSKQLK